MVRELLRRLMAVVVVLGLVLGTATPAYAQTSAQVASCADRDRLAEASGTGTTVAQLQSNPVALMVPKPECWMASTWKTLSKDFQIPRFITPIAIAMAMVAFVSQIYGHMTRSNPGGMMQTVVRGMIAGLVISSSAPQAGKEGALPGYLRSTWVGTYAYVNGMASNLVTPKIDRAAKATEDVLLNGPIGVLGQAAFWGPKAVTGAKVAAGALKGGAAKAATAEVTEATAATAGSTLRNTTKKAMENAKDTQGKLNKGLTLGYMLVMPFLSAYAGAVYASGMVTIGLGLVLPLLGAFVLLGSTKPLIGAFTAFLSNLLVIFVLPAAFMVALDVGFIQPQLIMQTYYQQAQQEVETSMPTLALDLKMVEAYNEPATEDSPGGWMSIRDSLLGFTETAEKVGAYIAHISDPNFIGTLLSQLKWVLIGSILGIMVLLMSFGLAIGIMVALPKMMGGLLGAQIETIASRNDGLGIVGKALKR